MQNSLNIRHLIDSDIALSPVERYRRDFLDAEAKCHELMAQTDEVQSARLGIGHRVDQQRLIDNAMSHTMDSLDNLINEPSQSLEDVLTKLNVIFEILEGTEQSPSEQLAISARNDLVSLLGVTAANGS